MQPPTDSTGSGSGTLDEARRVHAQHGSIMAQIDALAARFARQADAEDPSALQVEVTQALRDLAQELSRHFRDEEEVGFVRHASESAPRLSKRASRIVREHEGLRAAIERVVHDAAAHRPAWKDVRSGFDRFAALLREHEIREDELIQEALEDDLGGGG